GPNPRPSPPSVHRHAEEVQTDETAARCDPAPPRTPPATDQGLRYEPRRPRHIQMSSQTPNNAAVTALTSADTPNHSNHDLGGSGAGAVANGSAVGLSAPAGVSPRAAFASTMAGIASVSSPRPSNRACGSPAHGLPTFFTGGIRLSKPETAWAGRRSHQG